MVRLGVISIMSVFALGFAQTTQANELCGNEASYNYVAEDFATLEGTFLRWETRYQNAPMYSQQRQRAYQKMSEQKQGL